MIFCLPDVDLQTQIDASLAMPATYQTLCARAHLAQQCCGLAREQTRICEKLVHDQHLQQQGWAAVVANLEDITLMFQTRAEQFQQAFVLYLAERQRHTELLDKYDFSIIFILLIYKYIGVINKLKLMYRNFSIAVLINSY